MISVYSCFKITDETFCSKFCTLPLKVTKKANSLTSFDNFGLKFTHPVVQMWQKLFLFRTKGCCFKFHIRIRCQMPTLSPSLCCRCIFDCPLWYTSMFWQWDDKMIGIIYLFPSDVTSAKPFKNKQTHKIKLTPNTLKKIFYWKQLYMLMLLCSI